MTRTREGKARTAGRKPAKGGRASRNGTWWAGLCCGAVPLISPATSLLLLVLLLPGLAGLLLAGRSHPTARAALLFGMAGSLAPLLALLSAGPTAAAAMATLRRPEPVVVAWASAAAGWLVTEATATAIAAGWSVQDRARRRRLQRAVDAVEAEWGPFPVERSP